MGIVYRLLGLFALIGQRMSRTRVNFVPINWAVMGALLVGCAVSCGNAVEGFSNGTKPVTVLISDIVGRRVNLSQNYVRVSGIMFPGDAITSKRRSKYETEEQARSKEPSKAWVPLVMKDAKGNVNAIFVQLADPTAIGGESRKTTITGLLKPMDSKVRQKLEEDLTGDDAKGIDLEYVLLENAVPGNGWSWTVAAIVCGIAFGGMLLTFLMRYIVFQKHDVLTLPLPGPVSAATFDREETFARATGQFYFLERNLSQRFLNVPVLVTQAEDGSAVLVANVDASKRFGIFTTDRRAGFWAMPLGQMAGHPVEKGNLYLGASAMPSLRIMTVASSETGPSQTIILSAPNQAERDQIITALITPHTPKASDSPYVTATPTQPAAPLPFDL